jgi:HK97 family phage major capsid protein
LGFDRGLASSRNNRTERTGTGQREEEHIVDKLLASLQEIDTRLGTLLAKDELTEADVAEHDRLVADREKAARGIERARAQQAREDERRALEDEATARRAAEERRSRTVGAGRKTDPDQASGTRIVVKENDFSDDPKRGFKDHREFLTCVMHVGRGGRPDDRLRPLFVGKSATAGSDEAGGYSDPYGGVLVPHAFSPDLMTGTAEADPIGAYTTKIPMETPTISFPARVDKNHSSSVSGGLRVYRRAETQAVTASRMELEEVELKASSLMGVSYVTEELLARSLSSYIALLSAGFSDEFAARLIYERLDGTGGGEFEGVLNTPCKISVAKETGQAAATIVWENVVKMRARAWRYSVAIWLANHDTLPQLLQLNQSIGTGGVPVWQPSGREDHPDVLLGRPLFFSEFAKTLGTTGDLLLGNWSQYLEGTLTPMQDAESVHVRFLNHERTFKFWLENAGRCWWRAALTPKNGSTLSPFVALDTRA